LRLHFVSARPLLLPSSFLVILSKPLLRSERACSERRRGDLGDPREGALHLRHKISRVWIATI
jgi:hypothetical protein